jgi:hypothetical protein
MRSPGGWAVALVVTPCVLAACQSPGPGDTGPSYDARPQPTASGETPVPVLMPDLVGLPSADAGRRLGRLEASAKLGIGSDWGAPTVVRCGVRPRTVVRQEPAPGTPLARGAVVRIRTAALDLDEFRGPCEPVSGELGPVVGPDAALARQFYRFAADPSLGAPFVSGDVWTGIEDGPTATLVGDAERADLASWELRAAYAERSGPFSALDVVASSGGYYELRRGVAPTCASGGDTRPSELAGLRAVSLTAPLDATSSCMEWWAVTLFLDDEDRIGGVALRLGSP